MKYITLILLAPFIALAQIIAENEKPDTDGVWKSESPDKRYFYAIRRMPTEEYIWKEDLDGFRLVVFPYEGKQESKSLGDLYFTFDEGGRLPETIKWTADSKFIVFTTTSSGGHSPWQFITYVFSVVAKKIVCLDDVIGPVVDGDFNLEAPHTGTFRIGKAGEFAGDFEHPTPKKLDIALLFSENSKDKIEQGGADQPTTAPESKSEGKDKPQPESKVVPQ